jgi:hypothetical protein
MPRVSASADLDEVIRAAIAPVLARASAAVAKAIAQAAGGSISREMAHLKKGQARPRGRAAATTQRSRRRVEMTEWAADRRARRVPTFVIELTGLDTKKKIVAKFGEGATFRRGKPAPAPLKDSSQSAIASPDVNAARVVKAKPPRVRKASRG